MAHKRYVDFISGSALDALIRGKAREITVGGTSAGNAIQVNALQR
jgi:cyanophycinase-like exopeptidase